MTKEESNTSSFKYLDMEDLPFALDRKTLKVFRMAGGKIGSEVTNLDRSSKIRWNGV